VRFNFENITRYLKYNELTHRRQFSKYFDWFKFNHSLVDFISNTYVGVIDCSFISKSGKKTLRLDNASQTIFGLVLPTLLSEDLKLAF